MQSRAGAFYANCINVISELTGTWSGIMNKTQRFGTALLFSLACISQTAFAGFLTFNVEGESDSGPFIFSVDAEDIQRDKTNQISVDTAGRTQSFHNTGVNLSFDIERPGDYFSVKPIFDLTVTGFRLTRLDFDLYMDEDPNDERPGVEVPIKISHYDKNLFLLDNRDPLILRFTAIDPGNIENTRATFVFQKVPEPSPLLLFLLGSSILWVRVFLRKV